MSSFAPWLLLFTVQSSDQIVADFEEALAANNLAMDAAFSCMDIQTKEVLKEHLFEPEAPWIVDFALQKCDVHFDEMRKILTSNQDLVAEAETLVIEFRDRVRVAYIENIGNLFVKEDFAQSRADMATMKLGDCVRDKVNLWASQSSQPETLAKAAVSSCRDEWNVWRSLQPYSIKAKKLRVEMHDYEARFKTLLIETATVWVFEARSK
ncbi:hypothetical protein [Erythrobacter donghaensis]|uniref:hypothetical protein n=1 Tax=Erythrobacter donghaensis TaxID=267135 RepID=UPI00117DCF0D|nr:hypothetical protein [Erythrobacter donghaensis]